MHEAHPLPKIVSKLHFCVKHKEKMACTFFFFLFFFEKQSKPSSQSYSIFGAATFFLISLLPPSLFSPPHVLPQSVIRLP